MKQLIGFGVIIFNNLQYRRHCRLTADEPANTGTHSLFIESRCGARDRRPYNEFPPSTVGGGGLLPLAWPAACQLGLLHVGVSIWWLGRRAGGQAVQSAAIVRATVLARKLIELSSEPRALGQCETSSLNVPLCLPSHSLCWGCILTEDSLPIRFVCLQPSNGSFAWSASAVAIHNANAL